MASSANADTELLTEHFGYPPVSLLDDIINSVNILAERGLNSVEQALLRRPPASLGFKPPKRVAASASQEEKEAAEAAAAEAHQHEVEDGTHQLETLLCASIDRNFDKFEIYVMRNILCVRPEDRDWMRLAHYEGLDFSGIGAGGQDGQDGQDDEDELSDAAIARLHRRLQASLKLGNALAAETARNEAMLAQLRTLAGRTGGGVKTEQKEESSSPLPASQSVPPQPSDPSASLAFLLDRGPLTGSDAKAPLTTTTAFALSQLPALRQLSSQLQQMGPRMDEDKDESSKGEAGNGHDDGNSSDGKSWRRERLEYVESQTRKHLERVRGLDLGRNGETLQRQGAASEGANTTAATTTTMATATGMTPAVEAEALTNILNILREHHGPPAKSGPAEGQDGEAMDES